MSEPLRPLLVIAGPTGTGKTAAAIDLASRLGGELIGADSVQVYRGFDIGSAKPTPHELGAVPHHLLDVFDPDQAVDAVAYARLADASIRDILGRGALPVVVGGTGLYLMALLKGVWLALADGYRSNTGDVAIDRLISRGGMESMLGTVWLIITALAFGGVVEKAGVLDRLISPIVAAEWVTSAVGTPSRAHAAAASQPACPPPTMMTPKSLMPVV